LGLPLSDSGFLYDPLSSWGGPPAYPVGFPLMLAPVYRFFGLSFRHFHYLISLFAAAFSLLTFAYLRGKTGSLSGAYALAVSLAFNPWLIEFKNGVLSDLPFAALTLLAVMAAERRKPYWAGLALGYTLILRTAAVALVGGIVVDAAYRCIRPSAEESRKGVLAQTAITLLVALTVRVLITSIFVAPAGSDAGYLNLFAAVGSLLELLRTNLTYYIGISRSFIPGSQSALISRIVWVLLAGGIISGFIRKMKMGPQLSEFFVLADLGMILVYPSWQGFRFLLPLVPLMLCYFYFGISQLGSVLFGKMARYVPVLAVVLIWLAFYPFLMGLQRSHRQVQEGPMTPAAQEAYGEIRRSTPPDSVFFAEKPRALALFTNRKAAFEVLALPPEGFRDFVKRKNIHYELIDLAGGPPGIADHKKQIPSDISVTDFWSNSRYLILKLDWN
jgi:hypothetical protein